MAKTSKKNRRNKSLTKKILKYTVFIPKTRDATKKLTKNTIKTVRFFLKNSMTTIKNIGKNVDKKVAKTVSSLTRKRRA
jgi:hypothetical protein